ncbi:HAD-IC family P-type ATPase, partial [Staphylococcus aureus]
MTVDDYETHIGNGISGHIQNNHIKIGSIAYLSSTSQVTASMKAQQNMWESQGATVIGVEVNQALVMMIALRDEPKERVKETIQQLRKKYDVVLLSGDSEKTVKAIADELGISHLYAEVKPEQKAKIVQDIQQQDKKVMMVGDG